MAVDLSNEMVRTDIATQASRSAEYTILRRSMPYSPGRAEVRAEYIALGIRRTAVYNVDTSTDDRIIAAKAAQRLFSHLLAPTVFCGACGYDHHNLTDCGDARKAREAVRP